MRMLAWLGIGAVLSACGESTLPGGLVCTTEARPSVSVLVRDAVSGVSITPGSTVHVQDGTFVDSIVVPANWDPTYRATPWASYERPGTYTVRARKSGYTEASVTGVRVTQGECHVNTVEVDLRLQPAP